MSLPVGPGRASGRDGLAEDEQDVVGQLVAAVLEEEHWNGARVALFMAYLCSHLTWRTTARSG
jgi:hypothetical protein